MAKVLNPLMSVDARGTISGCTYSRGSTGPTVRRKGIPVRRVRTTQPYNRALLGYLSRNWSILNNSQRESWRDWAATHPKVNSMGETYQQSGFNAFVGLNAMAMRLGATLFFTVISAPVADLQVGMATLEAVDGAAVGVITLNWTLLGTGVAGDFIEIQTSGPYCSEGRVEITNYRFDKSVDGLIVTADTSVLEVLAWYWLRARYVQFDGQTSAWLYAQHQAPDVP